MLSYVSVVQSALVPLSPLSAVPPLPLCPEIPTRGVSECHLLSSKAPNCTPLVSD